MILTLSKVAGSERSAHQLVKAGDTAIGEIWREQVNVVVSKLTEPRRMGTKWRWFAKRTGSAETLGRGTRAAYLLGPGYKSKNEALSALDDRAGNSK
ncbi:hypothetical protein BLA39750_01133 [Burkholderia lata]|uniref:Uncharacterized protein n=1 Tax=Burkholderia lata (strain ATCC 17760 / DSM 23089 / LMG 22485 / NCIMB 9086 / R18194 / 383) TaxID=482957 RepID=A0A6P2VET5_BURL3|nr:hypothetical protein [Burkholderia lata]VWC80110.1 hypothetical protein BLA39750_01133 [Burkholderia lata]